MKQRLCSMSEKAVNVPTVSIYAYVNSGVYKVNKVKKHWVP